MRPKWKQLWSAEPDDKKKLIAHIVINVLLLLFVLTKELPLPWTSFVFTKMEETNCQAANYGIFAI